MGPWPGARAVRPPTTYPTPLPEQGERAMKTLLKMVGNVVDKPDEAKFRTIKCDNEAFRKRVSSFSGGVAMLKAGGFVKDELANTLSIADDDLDEALPLLREVRAVLQARMGQ